jgi:hypothetical protein
VNCPLRDPVIKGAREHHLLRWGDIAPLLILPTTCTQITCRQRLELSTLEWQERHTGDILRFWVVMTQGSPSLS